ncbi:restriction endonuclease subunit S [Chryseobacterium sp. HSC-36S06]|uniref:restriction endonuclease subunit S n=1 Tax=Chryseobacterium sp. HSC-36S06 TaxID=2910970 RepID=UPI00209DC573|nr:restriction endonuclease subunit S [Chryseobacterium sp. HSC-36S06]MCP2038338.1 type I restriction enzyme S subunit [Chryseobacterium sp. HSC-36S06]
MKLGYKRLGNYIQLVDERNKNLEVTNLLGISVTKNFIPSVANIIGTDMANYKIVRKNQFACSVMQVRRDKKMPVALYLENKPSIISQAYPVFEIIDETLLLPEYLMMWFTRSEFDREACFLAVGGVRGSLEWEDFLNMELPIPSPEKQKEMIEEYETIENRIQLNKKLCATLEETAQTIYKHWFEDFEFPDENGKPYKSSGGEMAKCEELGKEIPKAFKLYKISELIENSLGGDWGKDVETGNYTEKVICVRGADINLMKYGNFDNAPIRYIIKKNLSSRNLQKNNIVIELSGGSPTQSTGRSLQISEKLINEIRTNLICSNFCRALQMKDGYSDIVFAKINFEYDRDTFFRYENSSHGVKNLNIGDLFNDLMIATNESFLNEFSQNINVIKDKILTLGIQNQKLEELKSLLLGKMAVEN